MGETQIIITLILFNIIFLAFIAGILIFIREYRIKKKTHLKQIETIDETHKQELLETQVEIQMQTMQYIGREIHDNIGQKLTLASLYTQQLAFENKAPQVNKCIENIGGIINESLSELRRLSKSLTDNSIEIHSIFELIENECEKINALKKCVVHFTKDSKTKIESYQIKSIIFRITQEFLQNSIKHANCENIFVLLKNTDNTLVLILKDDGKGFNTNALNSEGIGLKNIKKRTELIGGQYKLESLDQKGTTLTIEIPIK
ncbi:two-component sensor histidine kinase [Olleya aquimaris]|nr:two-component sensor histidine kinase [Olleya aquimaris]